MKKISLYFCFIFSVASTIAQTNLVPNPSFEVHDTCPSAASQIQYATGWSSFRNTPDYFNTCATIASFAVPNNLIGYQIPASGNAYSGINAYLSMSSYKETMGAQLTTPLTIGQKYFVSFETVLSNIANGYGSCAIDKMGAKFSTIQFSFINPVSINNSAQIFSSSIITDTLNWTRIRGSFIADSMYSYIILGDFFDGANTDTTQIFGNSNCAAYYMIDNVCVSTDSAYTYNYDYIPVIIKDTNNKPNIYIYPNPAIDFINIDFPFLNEQYDITIYDVLGNEIFSKQKIINTSEHITIANFNGNILFIKILYQNKQFNSKLIKLKQ